ncbi:hypothetical protein [Mycolicibacterium alvei]|uniref:Uncharacterized protein n=1 Tax=Mycolicibacterium alvei TaxID=67081 RepID=A0A6N4USR4_9MYCO|nr:hypothetical protein [Mycolicibacterium alvei]MCV7002229.1 hypothetical protein [Mycolicibacterium alvei]BBX27429.1 hypothetical protein MALV_25540 [Mycolicibacterium alvei]
MASKTVDAVIFDGDKSVAKAAGRPVRLMPGGVAGIVYSGWVYPLYEGDVINIADDARSKEECNVFVSADVAIPYARRPASAVADGALGIEEWYLETNRFGHYLVFDGSEEAAERLVEAVDTIGLGVRGWGESWRPADNGEFYDWYIRLGYNGTREECVGLVGDLIAEDVVEDYYSDLEDVDGAHSVGRRHQLASLVIAASSRSLDADTVMDNLEPFDADPACGGGYLAWRLREVTARPVSSLDDSAASRLKYICSIVRDDRELIARLISRHGRFLENRPHLAERALATEFDKVDVDTSWRSPDDALRRARASQTFLRHAVMLTFGTDDCSELLQTMLTQLMPPAEARVIDSPRNVAAAIANLTRTITLVDELLGVDDPATLYAKGRAELLALEAGDFDFLAALYVDGSRTADRVAVADLPFEVLPPGELVQSFVDEVRRSGTFHGREADVQRTAVLLEVAKRFPDRKSTVHRGAFSSTGNDNGYVVLRMALPNSTDEDAIAISPWKGEHATYVVRHGCGQQYPWPSVLSRTKREAKELGARSLLFRVDLDHKIDVYEAMVSKIVALLECDRDEFDNGQLYFDYSDGRYRVRDPDDYDRAYSIERNRNGTNDQYGSDGLANVFRRILNWFGS